MDSSKKIGVDLDMTFRCKICGKITDGKNNRFYCDKCRETMKGAARHWELSKTVHVWIKNNSVVRAVINGENVKAIYVGREVVD